MPPRRTTRRRPVQSSSEVTCPHGGRRRRCRAQLREGAVCQVGETAEATTAASPAGPLWRRSGRTIVVGGGQNLSRPMSVLLLPYSGPRTACVGRMRCASRGRGTVFVCSMRLMGACDGSAPSAPVPQRTGDVRSCVGRWKSTEGLDSIDWLLDIRFTSDHATDIHCRKESQSRSLLRRRRPS